MNALLFLAAGHAGIYYAMRSHGDNIYLATARRPHADASGAPDRKRRLLAANPRSCTCDFIDRVPLRTINVEPSRVTRTRCLWMKRLIGLRKNGIGPRPGSWAAAGTTASAGFPSHV